MDTDLYYGKDGESFFDAADEDERITERALRDAGAALDHDPEDFHPWLTYRKNDLKMKGRGRI